MKIVQEKITISGIPSIVWGGQSDEVFLVVHGKKSCKEEAQGFAEMAVFRGFQVLSFDLPEHGERANLPLECTAENGVRDLQAIARYAAERWREISLHAVSLGAYFALVAFRDVALKKSLLLSPILDMERLIVKMLGWVGATKEDLKHQQSIPTPMGETLSWHYYQYVVANPITKCWPSTHILIGSNDQLTESAVVERFQERFGAKVSIVNDGEHFLNSEEQIRSIRDWMQEVI